MTLHKEMSTLQTKNQTNNAKTALNKVLGTTKDTGCNNEFESMKKIIVC